MADTHPTKEERDYEDLVAEVTRFLAFGRTTDAIRELMLYIGKVARQRDQYKQVAELNAETVRQMQSADASEHEEFIARFGL